MANPRRPGLPGFNSPPGHVISAQRSKSGLIAPVSPHDAQDKTGLPKVAGDRMIATASAPKENQGEFRTDIYTLLTQGDGSVKVAYNGDRLWAKVTLTLETAGPVAIGTRQQITPVLSGRGILLQTDKPTTLTISKGTQLFIASTSVNRVKVQIEPFPWLEQITAAVRAVGDVLKSILLKK